MNYYLTDKFTIHQLDLLLGAVMREEGRLSELATTSRENSLSTRWKYYDEAAAELKAIRKVIRNTMYEGTNHDEA